jgi:hypothetical protein
MVAQPEHTRDPGAPSASTGAGSCECGKPCRGRPPARSGQLVLKEIGFENHECACLPSTVCVLSKSERNEQVFFSFDPLLRAGRELFRSSKWGNWKLSPDGRTLAHFPDPHTMQSFSLEDGVVHKSSKVILNDWWSPGGEWSADDKAPGPKSHCCRRAGHAGGRSSRRSLSCSEGRELLEFEVLIPAPDGHPAIVGATVPGDNNAWMIEDF